MKYFIYVRKSTDVEDKQVLSVEAQIVELKEYAAKYELQIVDTFVEKRTAKKPGRPILNKMLSRISSGEANGILSWLPDRLSICSMKIYCSTSSFRISGLKTLHKVNTCWQMNSTHPSNM